MVDFNECDLLSVITAVSNLHEIDCMWHIFNDFGWMKESDFGAQ